MDADIVTLFGAVDDFCQKFEPEMNLRLLEDGTRQRFKQSKLGLSEVMTIIVWFHQSGYRTFKDYYTKEVAKHWRWVFPKLVRYNRFVESECNKLLGQP